MQEAETSTLPALRGTTKAAVLLVSLGVETASSVLKCLDESEVERLTVEIARLRNVNSHTVASVMDEFRTLGQSHGGSSHGGADFARQALEAALGDQRAEEVFSKVEAAVENSAFHQLSHVETSQLSGFLQNEHPQTAALILSHIAPKKSAEVVSMLPAGHQEEVIFRLATMGKTSPALLKDIEEVLREQVGSVLGAEMSTSGGVELAAEILNNSNRSTERAIMEALTERDAELSSGIKALMFVFDDLVGVADRDLQRLLTEIDQKDLVLSLKGTTDELSAKITGNLSERAAAAIEEELELLGPVKITDVEEAQRRIVETAQELEEREEIQLARSTSTAVMV